MTLSLTPSDARKDSSNRLVRLWRRWHLNGWQPQSRSRLAAMQIQPITASRYAAPPRSSWGFFYSYRLGPQVPLRVLSRTRRGPL